MVNNQTNKLFILFILCDNNCFHRLNIIIIIILKKDN